MAFGLAASTAAAALRRAIGPRRTLAFGLLLVSLFNAVPASAVSSTTPTYHETGGVTCVIDFTANTRAITIQPGSIQGSNFYGTIKTWSWALYSYDKVNWYAWYGTPMRTYQSRGSGTFTPLADTKGPVAMANKVFYVKVQQAYEWYDASGAKIGTTQWLNVDWYTVKQVQATYPYYAQASGNAGCTLA